MIIIEIPEPAKYRLVLVGERVIVPESRDATPADLERGGYVLREPGDYYSQWAAERDRAEKADLYSLEETARANRAEGLLIQRETELRLAREDGAAVERQMREARSAADASFVRANQADMRAEKAERERDEALGRAQSETEWRVRAVSERQDAEAERDTLRAELARLTAPGEGSEGEPGFEHLRDCWDMAPRADASGSDVFRNGFFALYRLGVAHERARQQPRDRATDEELFAAYQRAFVLASDREDGIEGDPDPERLKVEHVTDVERAAVRAVAARVWQERTTAPCVTCHGHGRIYRPDDALNDDDGATCRTCGGTGHERTDAEWLDQAMRAGLAQCDTLRRTVTKLTERCEQWEGERNAIAFVLSTTAEQRKDAEIGSLGYATLARLLGEVGRG